MNALCLIGLGFAVAGVISLGMNAAYYDYVDADGVLHESFYLPLGFILGFVGLLLGLAGFVRGLIKVLLRRPS
ncbi:hypothetical protein AUC68_11765 [Methyloceanibacter methanicus]|uniref:DUF3955 domain-containing protein n=1 Tax=Methyloceanibacter methanicus TaxID=1774968 RepID=A0A1E3W5F9_9HYPH|nr:hypothetical protein AUC68_11765 [Methyloceanibacter methanicus]